LFFAASPVPLRIPPSRPLSDVLPYPEHGSCVPPPKHCPPHARKLEPRTVSLCNALFPLFSSFLFPLPFFLPLSPFFLWRYVASSPLFFIFSADFSWGMASLGTNAAIPGAGPISSCSTVHLFSVYKTPFPSHNITRLADTLNSFQPPLHHGRPFFFLSVPLFPVSTHSYNTPFGPPAPFPSRHDCTLCCPLTIKTVAFFFPSFVKIYTLQTATSPANFTLRTSVFLSIFPPGLSPFFFLSPFSYAAFFSMTFPNPPTPPWTRFFNICLYNFLHRRFLPDFLTFKKFCSPYATQCRFL